MIPGTKPAAKDLPEKVSFSDSVFSLPIGKGVTEAPLVLDAVADVVLEPVEVVSPAVEVGRTELEAACSLLCAWQTEFWQVYPIGQQDWPHDWSSVGGCACS